MAKKRVFIGGLVILLLLGTASCAGNSSGVPPFLPETNTKPEISVEIVRFEKEWGRKSVTVRFSNNTDNTLYLGKNFQLLYFNGTSWEEAKHKFINRNITLEASPVEPGMSREETFVLSSKYFVNAGKQYFFTVNVDERLPSGEYEVFQYGVLLDMQAPE